MIDEDLAYQGRYEGCTEGKMEDRRRRTRKDYEQLDRILLGAEEALEEEDLRGTNEALKKANVKAASM